MKGKEYINHQNELTIIIDGDGDNYDSFENCVSYIRENIEIIELDYYSGFFDDAHFCFKHTNEEFKVTFSGFMGTELRMSESSTEVGREKFRQIAKNLITNLNN